MKRNNNNIKYGLFHVTWTRENVLTIIMVNEKLNFAIHFKRVGMCSSANLPKFIIF